MSTLFPTLKAMGEGRVRRVFYLTAKTITRTAAEEALHRLQSNGMVVHAVTLTAKDKVCFKAETRCQKEYCEFADGYYDRLNEGLLDLLHKLETFVTHVESWLSTGLVIESHELLLDTYYAVQAFIRVAQLCDSRYVTYTEVNKQDVTVKMSCMDPSASLEQLSKSFRAKIYFSTSLTPMPYYRYLLGAGEDPYTLTLPSPFQPDQLDVRIVPLSTKYKDRAQTKETLAELLIQLTREEPGNYLIFFPSYKMYMNPFRSVYQALPCSYKKLI